MNKKTAITLGLLGVTGILIGWGVVYRGQITDFLKGKKEQSNPQVKSENIEKEKPKKPEYNFKWSQWEDPAGFSFEYPKSLEVDVNPDDTINYANLELTSKQKRGKIIILCNDTKYNSAEEWAKKSDLVKNSTHLETKIAGLTGQKVNLGEGREISAIIDMDKVIYTIEKQPEGEKEYWGQIYTHIIESFKLIPLEGETEEEFSQWLEGFDTEGVDVVAPVEVIQ